MHKAIYADHAATTPLSTTAKSAMEPYFVADFYNPSTKYSSARNARKAVIEAREIIAKCIGAKPSEIYFTSGGTESDNWAIKGTMFVLGDNRCVITSAFEHHAILNACAAVEKMGFPVAYVVPDQRGYVQTTALSRLIGKPTKLVSIMMVNNELGTIQPIEELSQIAHDRGALFHTDAVQAVGHIDIDVNKLGIDMLSASAHKFGGPKGIGFLYVREGTPIDPLLSGGSQEGGFRAGTENVPGIVGMAAALQENCIHMQDNLAALSALRERFIQRMNSTNINYCINGGDKVYPGIISLSLKGCDGEAVLHRLDLMGIAVATGSACDSKEKQISHVLSAVKIPNEYAYGTIRVSLSADNTIDEVDTIVNAINKICKVR